MVYTCSSVSCARSCLEVVFHEFTPVCNTHTYYGMSQSNLFRLRSRSKCFKTVSAELTTYFTKFLVQMLKILVQKSKYFNLLYNK